MAQYRVGIITKDGNPISNNFNTKKEVDNFVLEIAERFRVKFYKVINIETREVIEKGENI